MINMKTTMAAMLIMIIALSSYANALSSLSPQPVAIKLSKDVVAKVTMTNLQTSEVLTQYTGTDGGTVFEWANSERGLLRGHQIKVEVLGYTKVFTYAGNDQVYLIEFDVAASLAEKCVITQELGYDETVQSDSGRCQVYVHARPYEPVKCVVEIDNLKAGETRQVFDNECDITITAAPQDNTLAAAIAIIFALFGAGAYVRIQKSGSAGVGIKSKNGKILHSHKNVRGYHSPDTVHKMQPHKKGEMYPRYSTKKNTNGEYEYLG